MDFATAFLWMTLRLAEMPEPPRLTDTILVTAAQGLSVPTAVTALNRTALDSTPAATLDDALRSVPGFSLFRRSSSRVANPTTQGVTLRGLAASGSSRALVLTDGGVPLNDPVGGWVYWNRVPLAGLNDASVGRGAAGDLYGADAVGGTVTLDSAEHPGGRIFAEGGTHAAAKLSSYVGGKRGNATIFGSFEGFTTDGFIIVAPESRGPIDTPAASRHASVHGGVLQVTSWGGLAARAGHFRESRENGTPFQRNATRVTHTALSVVGTQWYAQGYGQWQRYDQTFSAVLTGRTSERPTSDQQIDATAFGVTVAKLWNRPNLIGTLSARRVGAELVETEFSISGEPLTPSVIEPTQATVAVAGHWSWGKSPLSGGVAARTELWQSTLDGDNRHVFFTPRIWLTYVASWDLKVNVAVQSAYRGPTINELYRPFRVGNTFTRANPLLKPEGVHGIEAGISRVFGPSTVRVLGFWSRVDDAIVNVTLGTIAGVITRERQNAARIRARGAELELESRVSEALTLTASSAYTDSTFVEGPLQGLRVPQVPRWHHAVGGRGAIGPARWSAEYRFIDEQFDDDRNQFPLEESSMFDARVGWMLNRRIEIFGAIENVLDEEQDVGRTPIRTIGLPRTSRVGLRFVF